MKKVQLNPYQEAELRRLRRQLNEAQNKAWCSDPAPNAKNELEKCRQEYKDFKRDLRESGLNI